MSGEKIVNISSINATDWNNVTINEDQLLDLQRYVRWANATNGTLALNLTLADYVRAKNDSLATWVLVVNTTMSSYVQAKNDTAATWSNNKFVAFIGSILNVALGEQNISANWFYGNVTWVNLTKYPAACSAGFGVSEIGDTNTCTQFLTAESDPQWKTNLSAYNSTWISTTNASYLRDTGDTATGNYTFDSNTFFIDSTKNRVGIGTSSLSYVLEVAGNGTFTGNLTIADDLNMDQDDFINLGAGQIVYNGTCIIIKGSSATLEIC